ncbi:hypothetical protein GTA08_BOTSDO05454 [Neofusicoccum parvum]|nr:hypothetical protein GTA08_BOTSDO05454 [Neofusicoccum parvum]
MSAFDNHDSSASARSAAHPTSGRGRARPLASAAAMASAEHAVEPPAWRDSAAGQRQRPATRRSNITPVACQPCQQRKHKVSHSRPEAPVGPLLTSRRNGQCDGARPVCSPCLSKKRPDCVYDAAGDQRRTSSLKQHIRELERETQDLKDIISGIGSASDSDGAVAIAQQLAGDGFRATAHVASSLRDAGAVEQAGRNAPDTRQERHREISESATTETSSGSVAALESMEPNNAGQAVLAPWSMDTQGNLNLLQMEFEDNHLEVSASANVER